MPTSVLSQLNMDASLSLPFNTTTVSLTATAAMQTINCQNAAVAITVTLPTPTTNTGRVYTVKRDAGSTGAVTIASATPGSIQNLNGTFTTTTTLTALGAYGQHVRFQSDGLNWHRIS